ncbi:hypothetical protein D5F01_LYC24244 [Larimichthys crocea]|uniref:CCHC-type domain-containing protein n=1 Tax=Larimichthys crocea TaxID=215358 RepID=A0A6G0HES6_LARCR|nr:hypothetical protein D5F01_LYC24244 [Larimichthys crocea]
MTEQPIKTLTKDLTSAPPPYAPVTPNAPKNPPQTPAGMYPTLQITAGKLYIDHVPLEEELDNTSVIGYASSTSSACSGSSEVSSVKFKNLPTPCKTSSPKGAEGHDITVPFSDRVFREERVEILKEMSRREEALARQLQELEEDVRQQLRSPPPSNAPSEVGEGPDNARVSLEAEGSWRTEEQAGRQVRVDAILKGQWEKPGGPRTDLLIEEEEEGPVHSHPRRMLLRSGKQLGPDPLLNMPLIKSGNCDKYRPFGIGDVQALVDKLPPVSEGGNLWLAQLDSLTAGQRLALGDFRAVISRCLTGADVREIEIDAQTHSLGDDTPFTRVSTPIGKAMRAKYPLPNAAAMPKIKWDPKQNPREFLDKSKDIWIKHSGEHPGKPGVQREWYRQAILEGVPQEVKTAMKNNPDMLGCDSHIWERHIIHHLSKAQEAHEGEQDNLSDLQAQLLKIQIAKTKQELKKTEKPSAKVMIAAQQVGTPDFYSVPHWAPQPPPLQPPYRDGRYPRGRGAWRGGRGRGGNEMRWAGSPGDHCHHCGAQGHWRRDCPHRNSREDPANPYMAGRGRGQNGPPLPYTPGTALCPTGGGGATQMPVTEWDRWEGCGDQYQQ